MCAENTMTTTTRFSNYSEGHIFLLSIEEYEMGPAACRRGKRQQHCCYTYTFPLYTNNYSNDNFRMSQLYRYTTDII